MDKRMPHHEKFGVTNTRDITKGNINEGKPMISRADVPPPPPPTPKPAQTQSAQQ